MVYHGAIRPKDHYGLGNLWTDYTVSDSVFSADFSLLVLGILTIPAKTLSGAKWAQAVLMLVWVLAFDLSIGPLAYAIVGEV